MKHATDGNLHSVQPASPSLSRRAFLRNLAVTLAGGLAVACAAPSEVWIDADGALDAPQMALPSPQPLAGVPEASQLDDLLLAEFLALSVILTGVTELNPVLGRVYLHSLQASNQFGVTVADLVQQAGISSNTPPTTLEELEATGIFENNSTRDLSDKIIEYWYTGTYDTAEGGQAVATFVDALAWATLTFTKPATLCGSPGFWASPPYDTLIIQ